MAKHIADQLTTACSTMQVGTTGTVALRVCSVKFDSMVCAPAPVDDVLGSHPAVLHSQGAWRLATEGGWEQLLLWLRSAEAKLLIVLENAEHRAAQPAQQQGGHSIISAPSSPQLCFPVTCKASLAVGDMDGALCWTLAH